jgi:hypothetical protein
MKKACLILTAGILLATFAHAESNGGGHVVGNPEVADQTIKLDAKAPAKPAKGAIGAKDCDCSKAKKGKADCSAGKDKKAADKGDCAKDCDCAKKK